MLSLEQLLLFTLLHTNPAYAENKWRLVLYDFFWNTRSATCSHNIGHPDCVMGESGDCSIYEPCTTNRMAWQWAETLVEIRGTLVDIRGTTK